LSRFLEAYESYVAQSTDAPREFGHAAGLACLSTIALEHRWIARGTGIRPNLFLLLVADSSRDRKSTSVTLAVDLLRDVVPNRVGPEDFTAEGLVSYLRHRRGRPPRTRILLPMPEFGQNLAAAGSYGATIAGTLCKLYDGENFERVRAGKKPTRVVKPRVSAIGAVAYGMLEKYANPLDWVTGLFARFFFVTPQTRGPRFAVPPEQNLRARDLARACLTDLHAQLKATRGAVGASREATARFQSWAEGFAANLLEPALLAQRERLMNTAWKFAMLYQTDLDPCQDIGPQAMDRATRLAEAGWASVLKVYTATMRDEQAKLLDRIWEAVDAAGPEGVGRSDLLRRFALKAPQYHAALELLQRNGAVTLRRVTREWGGRTYARECVFIREPFRQTTAEDFTALIGA